MYGELYCTQHTVCDLDNTNLCTTIAASLQGYKKLYEAIQDYTLLYQTTLDYSRLYKVIQGYIRLHTAQYGYTGRNIAIADCIQLY